MATYSGVRGRPIKSRVRRADRGFSLWELAVLLGLLSLGVVAGFALLRARQPDQVEIERSKQMAAVDLAITNFLAINARLPCPDTSGAGTEDCAAGAQKGWLPSVTLGLDASAPGRGVPRMKYIVYRNGTIDLAAAADRFSPARWNFYKTPSEAAFFGPYSPQQISVLDFCKGLSDAANAPSSAAAAHIPGAAPAVVNVAYAFADGGIDRDGDGNVFDGASNPAGTPELDLPSRASSADYDDRVIARGFSELSALLNCQVATRSLDTIAQAIEVGNEVHSQAEAAKTMSIVMSSVNGVKALIQAAKLVASGFALATAVSTLAAAASALASAIASCIILIGCAFIPTAAAAVASAASGVALATSAVALNAAAVAYHVTATVQTALVAQKASAAVDPSSVDLTSLLAQVQQASVDAAAKASASAAAATQARADANAALANYNQKVADLRNVAHDPLFNPGYTDPQKTNVDPGDAKLNALISSYKAYADARAAFVVADGQYNRDLKKYNDALASNEAARIDALNNPTDANKQAIYQQTLSPDGVKYIADLLAAVNQSAAIRQTRLDAQNAAAATYSAALGAVNAAYKFAPLPGINLFIYLTDWINAMTNAYDDYLSKNIAANEKEAVAAQDARNAADAVSALNALIAAIAAQQNNPGASAITVFQGGEAILKEADLRGGLK